MYYHAKKEDSHQQIANTAKNQTANNQKKPTQETNKIGNIHKRKKPKQKKTPMDLRLQPTSKRNNSPKRNKEVAKWQLPTK